MILLLITGCVNNGKNKEMKKLILTALRQEPEIITEDANIDDKECKENKRYIIYSNKNIET